MRTDVEKGQQVFRVACEFLAVTEIKPELGDIAKSLGNLNEVRVRLTAYGVSQERSDRAYRSMTNLARMQARKLRRVFLKPVARVGKAMFRNDPAMLRTVQMPESRGYERLIVSANAMADEAAAHRESFVASGFGENFREQLKTAAGLLRQTIDARRAHLGRRSAATLGMMQEFAAGRELVRQLDELVTPWLEEYSPEQVAEWKTLTRFARVTPTEKVGDEVAGGNGATPSVIPEAHAA